MIKLEETPVVCMIMKNVVVKVIGATHFQLVSHEEFKTSGIVVPLGKRQELLAPPK
jgi:hypothetical protein